MTSIDLSDRTEWLAVGLLITPYAPHPRAEPFMIALDESGSARRPNRSITWRRVGDEPEAGTTLRIFGMSGPRQPDEGQIRAVAHPVPVWSPFGQSVIEGCELVGSLNGVDIGPARVAWVRQTGGGLPEGGLQACISWCHGGPVPGFGRAKNDSKQD